ncbi:MAG: ABC transporter ATP-binding protein [Bacteroidaceae bacterium]|nr:ABC transporter ATP-binding protein [Bacteroidaceae bacterium]
MIKIENVAYAYSKCNRLVFSNLNLTLEPGKVYGLLGENGVGKSTLLYLMMGLLRPSKGTVLVEGQEAWKRHSGTLAQFYLVPEEIDLPAMRLSAYVSSRRPFYPKFSDAVLRDCLEEFQLPADVALNSLSMGAKKKVLMSFGLASGASYLLMDEPTNGLDAASKKQFRRIIARYAGEGRSLVISTHQLHDVETMLDHILILKDSRLLLDESVASLTNRLSFCSLSAEEMDGREVLYAEQSVDGHAAICRRRNDEEETPLALELLFNAATNNINNIC